MRKEIWVHPEQEGLWSSSTYRTGSTTPPKSHSGLIAALLVIVILLGGMVSLLGMTSAKLFRSLNARDNTELPVSFSAPRSTEGPSAISSLNTDRSLTWPLGLQGESVSRVYQLYYRLPQGLFVSQVDPASSAAEMGIHPGDIVVSLDDREVKSLEDISQALADYAPGDRAVLTVYRNAKYFQVEIIVEASR